LVRVILVDDEQAALTILAGYCKRIPDLEVVKAYTDPLEVLNNLNQERIDLAILDIDMPGLQGTDLADILLTYGIGVIYITAHSEHAVHSYDQRAVDYVLKPVRFERFLAAVTRFRKEMIAPDPDRIAPRFKWVFIKSGGTIHRVDCDKIQYLQKDGHYIVFKTDEGSILSRMSMPEALEILPENQFARIHKSYIVSLPHIKTIHRHHICVADRELPLGDHYRDAFLVCIPHHGR